MRFSQKKTCKGCQIEGDDQCGVNINRSVDTADVPTEPCYKPITNKDSRLYFDVFQKLQYADLAIHRINGGGPSNGQ